MCVFGAGGKGGGQSQGSLWFYSAPHRESGDNNLMAHSSFQILCKLFTSDPVIRVNAVLSVLMSASCGTPLRSSFSGYYLGRVVEFLM